MEIKKDDEQKDTYLIYKDGKQVGGFTTRNDKFEIWTLVELGILSTKRYDDQTIVVELGKY